MQKQLLFIHGTGEGAHEADAKLAESLRKELGEDYKVTYPAMPNEADPNYDAWKRRIEKELADMQGPLILAAHSVGASMLLRYLSEDKIEKPVAGIFFIAAPFWGGDGWRFPGYQQFELPPDLTSKMPKGAPVFLYHCQDDTIVPFEHLTLQKKLLPRATARQLEEGGHQFDNDLSVVAKDIKALR